ncbi:MAG: ABC transporter ATP-binding protein [Bacillota bacterium]|nr:MAG: ABC transporter ATP-binding protein [Bacillota bacterium]
MALLEVEDLTVIYGAIRAVNGISLTVGEGEVVALIGANGAGKTTTLRAISRLVPSQGAIRFAGRDLTRLRPHEVTALGVVHVPEGRGIFPRLTVMENLELATWTRRRDREGIRRDLRMVFDLFPRLEERRHQLASTLSGGEQQMLALGRALMLRGRLMLLDEPSMGLAPILVKEIFSVIKEISAAGTTILLVEQNAHAALKIAHRSYVLETGSVVLSGPAQAVAANPRVKAAYLGA